MSRALDDLDPRFLPLAAMLLARTVEANIPVMIINTRRTAEEQAVHVANGTSWVKHSKHQDGLAIDICPWLIFKEYGDSKLNWVASDPIWTKLGAIGERLGLRWGGRWRDTPDLGHFEYMARPVEVAPV